MRALRFLEAAKAPGACTVGASVPAVLELAGTGSQGRGEELVRAPRFLEAAKAPGACTVGASVPAVLELAEIENLVKKVYLTQYYK